MAAIKKQNSKADSGFSLVELLVYVGLFLLIAVVLGTLLINILTVQNKVINSSTSGQQAQLISQTVESSVRNATAIQLTQVNATDQIVLVRSGQAGPSASWICMAFYFSATSGGSLRYQRSVSAIAVPTSAQLLAWTLLGSGLTTAQTGTMFSVAGSRLSFAFTSSKQNDAKVNVQSSVSARGGSWVSAPCF